MLTEWALDCYSRSREIDQHTVQHGKHDVRSLTLLGSLQEVCTQPLKTNERRGLSNFCRRTNLEKISAVPKM